ncbi:MAG: DNA starvation/stationary phase protection protein [Ignavibacteriaceae bacterium]
MNNQLVELLNKNLSDLMILYVKIHQYHWNVKGVTFKSVHDLTESYYNYFAEQYDEAAERIIQLGGKPVTSLKEYMNQSSIKEESKNDFDGKYVLTSILSDFEILNTRYKEISKTAGEKNDAPTAALADDNVAWLEKQIWMIKATLS